MKITKFYAPFYSRPNGKVPHQKPGVMVGHLHSTEKRLAQGFLPEKLGRHQSIVIGVEVCVYLRNKMI